MAGSILILADDLQKNLADGDLRFTDYKIRVDKYVSKAGLTFPEETSSRHGLAEPDEVLSPIREVDFKAAGISSIVWASGFRYDFDWVKLPIFDDDGEPVHHAWGNMGCRGLFSGIQWLYKQSPLFLAGGAGGGRGLSGGADHGSELTNGI